MKPGESFDEAAAAAATVKTLESAYGFDRASAERAVGAISDKSDVELALNWLLDNGEDPGGAVQFIRCPHLSECRESGESDNGHEGSGSSGDGGSRNGKARLVEGLEVTLEPAPFVRALIVPSAVGWGAPCARGCAGSETWLCLGCGLTLCSRYVHNHAAEHFEATGHCVSLSCSDLSAWCYLCQAYVTRPRIRPLEMSPIVPDGL